MVIKSFFLALCLAVSCFAQNEFLSPAAKIEIGIYASAIALDGWSTQDGIHQGGFVEENPFARPFVSHGISGQIGASAIGLAAGIGTSYLFYRMGHRKIARTWLTVFTAGESINSVQMFYRVTHHH